MASYPHNNPKWVSLKKNEKIWDNVQIGGGERQKCPYFNLGILKTEGGCLYFSKMSQSQLFCIFTFIKNVWNSKMSQFGQRGGGQHFSKMSQIQKYPKGRKGGGQP